MIIAVNIRKALHAGHTPLIATSRAWKLRLNRCRMQDYVIGVENGIIHGYFKINAVNPDATFLDRVAFDLRPCTPNEITTINHAIVGVNLRHIQKGKYI